MLEATHNGQASIAVLVGEPGIGKTRTAREFAAHADRQGVRVLRGLCYEGEATSPYGPWRAALQTYFGACDSKALASQLGRAAAEIAEIVPQIREKLTGLEAPVALPPAESRIRLFDSLISFLKEISRETTLLIVFDNLQWADPNSLQFLEHLATETQEERILILGTYREEDLDKHHPLVRVLGELVKHPSFHRIQLTGLKQAEVGRYIGLATGTSPESALVEEVHRRTAGNPLFMVEVVRDMKDHVGPYGSDATLPEGIRAVIERRLSRLTERCVQILSIASVIGRTFELEVVAGVTEGLSEDRVLELLERAMAAGIIEEVEDSTERYRFSHVLIQETLLSGISSARKA